VRDDAPRFHPQDAEDWWSWLAAHHDDPVPGVWAIEWRRASGRTPVDYEDLVAAALAYGWIDGTRRTIDDDRAEMWFTRRRPGSQWTRLSKERIAKVEASGRMTDAGRAVVDRAKADGTWSLLDSVEDGVVPDDLAAAFAARPGSREHFDRFTPGARRSILAWIVQAKRPETRAARITEAAEKAALGIPAHQQ
jgi:uncharacterized protein YdeI (YjbR/CyaY-like superfamily)